MKVKPIIFASAMTIQRIVKDRRKGRLLGVRFAGTAPPYEKGDILWVRERHRIRRHPSGLVHVEYVEQEGVRSLYWARIPEGVTIQADTGWRSPWFLPRWAARIWLEVCFAARCPPCTLENEKRWYAEVRSKGTPNSIRPWTLYVY